MNIFIINGGQAFAHSGGKLNAEITNWDKDFFAVTEHDIRITHIDSDYDPETEVGNFVWADVVIYHFPIWWFGLPSGLKLYLDRVLTAGHRKGLYYSDGRKMDNPERNYGTGGSLIGKKYMVTTTWNAPAAAFTIEGEFFNQTSVDDGILFGFHRMNAFLSMEFLASKHFHDVEKNLNSDGMELFRQQYRAHLENYFTECSDLTKSDKLQTQQL